MTAINIYLPASCNRKQELSENRRSWAIAAKSGFDSAGGRN